MPIYEYECKTCGEEFERLVKMEEGEKPQLCTKCNSEGKKKISQSSFSLKGGGWAADGYGGK